MTKRQTALSIAALGLCLGTVACDEATEPAETETETGTEYTGGDENTGEIDFTSCAGSQSSTGALVGPVGQMQAVGDSILGWNKESGESIPDVAGDILGVTMHNNATGGATLSEGGIIDLYEPGGYTHVLVNGGGNDFAAECSVEMLDSLIAPDLQSGLMVDLIDTVTNDGAQAVIVSYFMPQENELPCEHFVALQQRYRTLGEVRDDTMFVCTVETITPSQSGLYADDVHPSVEGSAAVGALVADHLR